MIVTTLITLIGVYCAPVILPNGHVGHDSERCYDSWDDNRWVWPDGVSRPPAKYDHKYVGRWDIIYLNSQSRMDEECHQLRLDACTYPPIEGYPYCVSFLRHSYPDKAAPEHIYEHEQAHCNGWPSDHPQS